MPSLSVLTATIPGREKSLQRAVESVSAQTAPILGHLIVSEAPDGPSPPHQARSLNRCLREAQGEWVAVLDDDNYWLPDHAGILLSVAATGGLDVIYAFDVLKDPPALPRENVTDMTQRELREALDEGNLIDGGAAIIRRSLLEELGGFPTEWVGGNLNDDGHYRGSPANYCDWELWRRLAAAGAKFYCVPVSSWVYNDSEDHLRMQTGLG